MKLRALKDLPQEQLKQKKVFVRIDYDVAFDDNDNISDTTRININSKTVKYLLENECSVVIGTKIGRPEEEKISTEKLLKAVSFELGSEVSFVHDYPGQEAKKAILGLKPSEVLLLENLRFFEQEKALDDNFAQDFAKNFDMYVNETFAMAHREETSLVLVPKYLPSYAGLNLVNEIDTLSRVLKEPDRPFVGIVGGVKIESKKPTVNNLSQIADVVLVGGKLGMALKEESYSNTKVILPSDYDNALDIGEKTIETYKKIIRSAKTVLWAGPLGKWEEDSYLKGTREIANEIAGTAAYWVIGGGDTIAAIDHLGLRNKVSFVSTGGGAMLTLLSGLDLAALKPLLTNDERG